MWAYPRINVWHMYGHISRYACPCAVIYGRICIQISSIHTPNGGITDVAGSIRECNTTCVCVSTGLKNREVLHRIRENRIFYGPILSNTFFFK